MKMYSGVFSKITKMTVKTRHICRAIQQSKNKKILKDISSSASHFIRLPSYCVYVFCLHYFKAGLYFHLCKRQKKNNKDIRTELRTQIAVDWAC